MCGAALNLFRSNCIGFGRHFMHSRTDGRVAVYVRESFLKPPHDLIKAAHGVLPSWGFIGDMVYPVMVLAADQGRPFVSSGVIMTVKRLQARIARLPVIKKYYIFIKYCAVSHVTARVFSRAIFRFLRGEGGKIRKISALWSHHGLHGDYMTGAEGNSVINFTQFLIKYYETVTK